MIELSPAELQSICNAANLGIKTCTDTFQRTIISCAVNRISKWLLETNWDDAYSRCIFIDELPF